MDKRIDVETAFKRVDQPPMLQPPDYTPYAEGKFDTKINVIDQEGLPRRKEEKEDILYPPKPYHSKPIYIHPKVGEYADVKNQGVLLTVDKFFNWLNRVMGEK